MKMGIMEDYRLWNSLIRVGIGIARRGKTDGAK